MERVITVQLRAADPDESHGVGDAVARLIALKYRTRTFQLREYEFPGQAGSVRAHARGSRDAIVAWSEDHVQTNVDGLLIVDRRSFPVPYLDWAAASVVATTPTTEFLITHKLTIRVSGEPGNERAFAEIVAGDDDDRHTGALASVCETVGLRALDGWERRVREVQKSRGE